jgi:hypothetical protein
MPRLLLNAQYRVDSIGPQVGKRPSQGFDAECIGGGEALFRGDACSWNACSGTQTQSS